MSGIGDYVADLAEQIQAEREVHCYFCQCADRCDVCNVGMTIGFMAGLLDDLYSTAAEEDM